MHIAILSTHYPPEGAPAAKRMVALANILAGDGHEVSVVTLAPNYPGRRISQGYGGRLFDERVEHGGVSVLRLRPFLPPRNRLLLRSGAEVVHAAGQFVGVLRKHPDVMVTTVPSMALAPVGAIAATLLRCRFVLDVRDLYWLYAGQLGKVPSSLVWAMETVIRRVVKRANVLTATTNEQMQYLQAHFPGRYLPVVAPNGVDDEFFEAVSKNGVKKTEKDGRLRIVYAGLIGYAQGLGVLIEAAKRLSPARWEIVIAGDGPEKTTLEREVADTGLNHVHFVGYLESDLLTELYSTADILYAQLRDVPAMETAQPTKLLDYLAVGRPVVFGGRGAGADLLNKSSGGIVVEPDHVDEFLQALGHLQQPEVRRRLGNNGRTYVSQYRLRSRVTRGLANAVTGESMGVGLGRDA